MQRKKFLHNAAALATFSFLPNIKTGKVDEDEHSNIIIPPYLKKGDTIGVTSPSGYFKTDEIIEAKTQIERWGFKAQFGKTIGLRSGTFGGSDEERAADFQAMLDDENIKAIMCARGGYGAVRVIDKIDFSNFRSHPKWIIGFSDATVFHTHIATNFRVATLHSKMCNSFPLNFDALPLIQQQAINSISDALSNRVKMKYDTAFSEFNKQGIAEGRIVGGNLRTIENLSGTKSEINTKDKILFIEEVDEYLYNIDRMLWNLKRAGKFNHIKGLIIGGISIKKQPNPDDELNLSLYDLVLEKVKEYDFPVCFNFPVGHQIANFALKCNVHHRLSVISEGTILEEI
ncbi:LD-carboxypeptidase [Arachidicoccus ginsenosidimutans]|uniref:S66 peptidase family protein n=1 Tax=Arachidicoccus sp. BS20 TaxID=1850526 RepID=UPI0007F05046|nr:LD-carboxypeptidase [Arachidicoccus sp. BS20]ANI89130.1 LD-carboxypeptidase [Arachidicoccus sp. BS20]